MPRSSPRRYKPPPVPALALRAADGAGGGEPEGAADAAVAAEERRRAAAAEAEVLRLSEELGGCQRELEHNRRLTAELRTALDQHHRSLAIHHRRQTVPAPNPPHLNPSLTAGYGVQAGEIHAQLSAVRTEHSALRSQARAELARLGGWLGSQLETLQHVRPNPAPRALDKGGRGLWGRGRLHLLLLRRRSCRSYDSLP